jgi:hypothetical protein
MNIINQIITMILSLLPQEKFKDVVDSILDVLEDKIAESENKVDDALVIPLINKVRELLNVPDND